MQQIVNVKFSSGPSARRPRHERSPLSALGANQGGRRARAWLQKNAGLACVAFGWVFAFAGIVASPAALAPEESGTPLGLLVLAIAAISFGCGWMCRDERGRK